MKNELPPADRSDRYAPNPREALRRYVRELAAFTTNADIEVTSWGISELPDERLLIARVVDFARALDPATRQLFPEHILELSVCNDDAQIIETLVISDGDDEMVTSYVGDTEYNFDETNQADECIKAFAVRYTISKLMIDD